MLSQLLKNKKFNLIISKFYKNTETEVLDLVLFGSAARGKEHPEDIDILILFKDKENLDSSYALRKSLEAIGLKAQIITKTYSNLFSGTFNARESFLSEGYSLIKKEFISKSLGYTNLMLFKYELKGFSQSKRMQLQYALYGRDKHTGIVKDFKLNKFADSVFLCPIENAEKLKEFFKYWNIKFESFQVLIPTRILS